MVQITNYETLLEAGREQSCPQRFLFVFAKSQLPEEHSEEEAARFKKGHGGELTPMMCVDKPLDELSTFAALALEAEKKFLEWQLVFVAAMSGENGVMPTTEAVEESLKMMVQTIQFGGDMSGYLVFNRKGDPIRFV